MTQLDSDQLESAGGIKSEVEEAILLHSWANTDSCPKCNCEASLRLGCEAGDDSLVSVPDCSLCDAVMSEIAGKVDFGSVE